MVRFRVLLSEVGPAVWLFLGNIVVVGWIYSLIEGLGPISGPWWAIVTGSTTGYGDVYPSDTLGRGIAAYLILSSMFLNALICAKFVKVVIPDPHLFSDAEQREMQAHDQIQTTLLQEIAERMGIDIDELFEVETTHDLVE